jgi:hypothetical protein
VLGCERPALTLVVQPGGFVKAPHLHRKFQRLRFVGRAGLAPARLLWRAHKGQHAQIQLRGRPIHLLKAPVHPNFGFAGLAAQRQRAEVHERKTHRLFDLVGKRTRQQHPGAVRFHQLHALHRLRLQVGIERRVQQGGDQRR